MTRSIPHPTELRAQVIAAVLAGTTIAQACRQFGLPKQTISRWMIEDRGTRGTEKISVDLETLILDYLTIGFHAMIAQAEVFRDPAYCRAQDADKLAIAHGVLGDKLAGVAETAQALGLIGTAPPLDTGEFAQLGTIAAPADADG